MLSLPAKLLFALSGAAFAIAFAYHVAVDERSGVALLTAVGIAALVAALALLAPDPAPFVPAGAPAPERNATTPGAAARGSAWPLLAALAAGVLAVGAATGAPVFLLGVLAALVVLGGWFGRAWSEDPTWTSRVRSRVSDRALLPVGIPLGTFLLTLLIAVSLSRVLLATSKELAALIALLVAAALLVAFYVLASRPRLSSSALTVLGLVSGAAVIGAGIAGAAQGEREFHAAAGHGKDHGAEVEIVAKDVAFDKQRIEVPAGEEITMEFHNRDSVYHNVAVYRGEGLQAVPVFNGAGFPGNETLTYRFRVPRPGTYRFVCDFHINMVGELVAR